MPDAVERGGNIIVQVTALAGGNFRRDLTHVDIEAHARFEERSSFVRATITKTNPEAGEFTAIIAAPGYQAGRLLLDIEYREEGVVNSSPTLEFRILPSEVEDRIDRLRMQYRESPKLINLSRALLRECGDVQSTAATYPSKFDLDTAVGDQLTMIGKRLGWPRCHCICDTPSFFGFDCGDGRVAGFCNPNAIWEYCGSSGVADFCIEDDEDYRTFLRARVIQLSSRRTFAALEEAANIIWPGSWIAHSASGRVTIAVGNANPLDPKMQLWPRVLPLPIGIEVRYHFGERPIFGFGPGWSGLADCDDEETLNPIETGKHASDWLCHSIPAPC